MKALIRWLLFMFVGLPIQGAVYVLYPVAWVYWKLFIYKELGDKLIPFHVLASSLIGKTKNKYGLLDNVDDHGAFSMYGAITASAMTDLSDNDHNLLRRRNNDGTVNRRMVSGDVVIAYCFGYTAPNTNGKPVKQLLGVARSYLKNLGVLSNDERNKEDVSNRCNNFGVNYCPDSDAMKIGQPAAGPQFYTNSCLFALASQHSYFFKLVFWTHWILMGGWYWAFWPMIYTKNKQLWYVRDMTMKALYVHKYVFGNRWWIKRPMETITYEMSEYRNDMWYAMMGLAPIYPLPESMDSFFSQRSNARSLLTDRMNGYLGTAIVELAKQAKDLNNK